MLIPSLIVLSCLLSFTFAGPHARLKSPKRRPKNAALTEILTTSGSSNSTFSPVAVAPKSNIFISLTDDEAAAVIGFLHNQTELNLTAAADAGAYFIVGPLPISNASTYESLDWATTSGSAKIRNYNADDDLLTQWNFDVTATVADIVLDLLNGTATGSDDDTFDILGIDPLWMEEIDGEERVILWNTYWRFPSGKYAIFDGETLLPQGLFFKSDITGRDSSKWKVLGWLYGDIFYSSTEEFRKAWSSPEFVKYELNLPGEWIGSDQIGTPFPADDIAPPLAVQPDGQRFSVDEEQKYVEWMDFTFYMTFTRDTGLRLFDIKYKSERIIYELGLQEAIAHYAGNDPVQSGTAYMDTFYGFGPYAFELVPGYDCPTYSRFLNTTFHASEISTTHRNNICLFESDAGYLMQRHSTSQYLALTRNIVFTLRSVSTVGNYDYSFALDGSVETIIRASGYIQSAYYAKNNDYGERRNRFILIGLTPSVQDTKFTMRSVAVDMDVLGTQNTFVKHEIVAADVKYPWANQTRSTMRLERVRVETEDDAKLSWPQNGGGMFLVENSDKLNKYGEPKGFKIAPSRGGPGMHLTIQNSLNLLQSGNFATHALYITKHKDTEVRSSHANNGYDPGNPLINFNDFFDGESLNQTDIVLWVNLGMHHVPHTGDMPNTVFTTAQSAFIISPHNYLLRDASRTTRQMVRIDYNSSGVQLVKEFGGNMASGVVNIVRFLGVSSAILAAIQYLPQISYTWRARLVGALSVPMMCIQSPGAVAMVLNIALSLPLLVLSHTSRRRGINWTSWIIYAVAGLMQFTLLSICLAWKFRQHRFHIDDFEAPIHPESLPPPSSGFIPIPYPDEEAQEQPAVEADEEQGVPGLVLDSGDDVGALNKTLESALGEAVAADVRDGAAAEETPLVLTETSQVQSVGADAGTGAGKGQGKGKARARWW
ncbi:Amine oxidase [Mycena sanguinolenta]|uniref:Amine oxidase n=1 Tax=Mycena sanguinolenta TaxID=230812 RepID=A0A8H6YM23_9AGAR|nr:Amine oxidase [Mycena sanguinolenta]